MLFFVRLFQFGIAFLFQFTLQPNVVDTMFFRTVFVSFSNNSRAVVCINIFIKTKFFTLATPKHFTKKFYQRNLFITVYSQKIRY